MFIIFLVSIAAILHAVWNALVKHSGEREVVLGFVAFGHFCLGFIIAFFVPFPSLSVWYFILVSALFHILYYYGLKRAYRNGDLSIVYPIARGLAPPLISLGGLIFAGENLTFLTWSGIILASLGLLLFALPAIKPSSLKSTSLITSNIKSNIMSSKEVFYMSLLTGMIIVTYSILDGLGGREAKTPLSYIAWLFICELPIFLWMVKKNFRRLKTIHRQVYQNSLISGLLAASAYAIVIYAKSLTELGIVSTLRETSIIFASLIGIIILKERPWKLRITASLIVVGGVVILLLGYY